MRFNIVVTLLTPPFVNSQRSSFDLCSDLGDVFFCQLIEHNQCFELRRSEEVGFFLPSFAPVSLKFGLGDMKALESSSVLRCTK